MSSIELRELPITFKRNDFFQELGIYIDKIKGKNIHLLNRNGDIIVSGKIEYIKPLYDHKDSKIKFEGKPEVYSGSEFVSVRMDRDDAVEINEAFNNDSLVPSFTEEQRRFPLRRLLSIQEIEEKKAEEKTAKIEAEKAANRKRAEDRERKSAENDLNRALERENRKKKSAENDLNRALEREERETAIQRAIAEIDRPAAAAGGAAREQTFQLHRETKKIKKTKKNKTTRKTKQRKTKQRKSRKQRQRKTHKRRL
jgi:hypothetical protein